MRPIIIAEAGVNHNGSLEMALQLVDAAADAGADFVKFQTFSSDKLVTCSADTADYQRKNCNADNQREMLRQLELSHDDFRKIAAHAREKGIGFLSTPFDIESIDFLASLDMKYMKIPSGEITNLPYLRAIAEKHIPVIMSTGMSTLADVENALKVLYDGGLCRNDITLLHCNTQYPTPYIDVNLKAMLTLHEAFGVSVGYSDHTKGIEVPIAATAMGATVIEKHFTLDKNLPGPDHTASLDPTELHDMVEAIKHIAMALGSPIKSVSPSERRNMSVARKSIVAAKEIREGDTFSPENLTTKRPGTGISPMMWDDIIGRTATRHYHPDDLIEL
ncbi:MAG: N-acetylneuraminate synthase [Muribaculaceae bacterium]